MRVAAREAQQLLNSAPQMQFRMAECITDRVTDDGDNLTVGLKKLIRQGKALFEISQGVLERNRDVAEAKKKFGENPDGFPQGIYVYDFYINANVVIQNVAGMRSVTETGLEGEFAFGRDVRNRNARVGLDMLNPDTDEYAMKIAALIDLGLINAPENVTQRLRSAEAKRIAWGEYKGKEKDTGYPRKEQVEIVESRTHPGVYLVKETIERKERGLGGSKPDEITEYNLRVVVGDQQHLPLDIADSSKYTWQTPPAN